MRSRDSSLGARLLALLGGASSTVLVALELGVQGIESLAPEEFRPP